MRPVLHTVATVILTTAVCVSAAVADLVILKDGSRIETRRAWEKDGYVQFILPGTETVVIRYASAIVARIEKGRGAMGPQRGPRDVPPFAFQMPGGPPPASAVGERVRSPQEPVIRPVEPRPSPPGARGRVDLSRLDGIVFYDPRRPNRYWVSRESQHNTLRQAVNALAWLYGRPAEWVESHLGESNDLGQIHSALAEKAGISAAAPAPTTVSAAEHPDVARHRGVAFYNPRRSGRYWSCHGVAHDTLHAAVEALAKQYGRTPEWVETHLGESNDLGQIHRNLLEADLIEKER